VLAVGYVILAVRKPGLGIENGAIILGSVALMSVLWLGGHRIEVNAGVLRYRDGLFRSRSIRLVDIESLKIAWVDFGFLGRDVGIPRLRVAGRNRRQSFLINPKPFSRQGLKELNEVIRSGMPDGSNSSRRVAELGQPFRVRRSRRG
jgi:hypothetical protein